MSRLTITSTISNIREVAPFKYVGQLPNGEPITIELGDPKNGSPESYARYRQACGELTKDQADHIVRVARLARRMRSSKARRR